MPGRKENINKKGGQWAILRFRVPTSSVQDEVLQKYSRFKQGIDPHWHQVLLQKGQNLPERRLQVHWGDSNGVPMQKSIVQC